MTETFKFENFIGCLGNRKHSRGRKNLTEALKLALVSAGF
jgi:hypothetical protein